MRDLASLYRAWRQLEAYEARGLNPAYRDAVFAEWHVPACQDGAPADTKLAVAHTLETLPLPPRPRERA